MGIARQTALLLCLIATAGLVAEFLRLGKIPAYSDPAVHLWHLARYFTILTNALVAGVMLATGLGRRVAADLAMREVVGIVMVGAVYQTLLRPAEPFAGLQFWTDLGMHAVAPLATLM